MDDSSSTLSQLISTIPPDDPRRDRVLARPDEDQNLPHISLSGGTYTILLTGEDTAGRYALIDMHVPSGAGPPLHRHDFEEMFTVLEGEIEITFRDTKSVVRARETVNIPATHRTGSSTPPSGQRGCYACAHRPGRKSSSWPSATQCRAGRRRRPSSTRRRKRRERRKPKRSPYSTGRSYSNLSGSLASSKSGADEAKDLLRPPPVCAA